MAVQDVSGRGYDSNMTTQTTEDPTLYADYYSCDLDIPIVRIEAKSKEQAEYVMQRFIDKIALVMDDKVHWDDANWTIEENVFLPELGEWHTK
jgi:hypothetical protein